MTEQLNEHQKRATRWCAESQGLARKVRDRRSGTNCRINRRGFIWLSGAAGALSCSPRTFAREPIARSGPPRFQFSLAAYSLRKYFSFNKGKANKPEADGPAIDMFSFVDYCAVRGFDGAELTSYFFPPQIDDQYLLRLKRYAFERGVTICGTAIGNNFTVGQGAKLKAEIESAKDWIDRAVVMGAPHIRFFAGTGQQLATAPERMDEAIQAIEHCADYAANKGIYLGIENHGRLTADQVLQIMNRVESPWVGVNLDTGNFVSDDPYADLEACAPYAVNIQVKSSIRIGGKRVKADFRRIAAILRNSNYQGHVVLEYEEAAPYDNIPQQLAELKSAFEA